MLGHGEVAFVFDLMDYGLSQVALPEEEQGGTRLEGDAPGKTLLHLVAGGEGVVCPGYLCHAAGAEVPFVAYEGFPAMAAYIREDELQEFVQGFET